MIESFDQLRIGDEPEPVDDNAGYHGFEASRFPQRRNTDPWTSDAAAHEVVKREGGKDEVRRGTQRAECLLAFLDWGGSSLELHQDDIHHRTGKPLWRRFSDLKRDGYLESTGMTKKGSSGRQQEIFRLSEKGVKRALELRYQ